MVFAGHLLVVWEHCVSVFPVPHVPADGQVVVEHKRVFMFQEAISRPIGFTTCAARHVVPPHLNPSADRDVDWDMDWDRDGQHKRFTLALGISPTLTIAARSRRRVESISMVMLIPLEDEVSREKAVAADTTTFPYRLAYLPSHFQPGIQGEEGEEGVGGVGDSLPRACTTLCLGWSGRGVFVVGRELRLVSPDLLIVPPFEMQLGPAFETGEALYLVDRPRQRDLNRLHLDGIANVEDGVDQASASGDKVDFDEGMGRFVVAKERGGFEVLQLD